MAGFKEKAIFVWNDSDIGDAAKVTSLLVDAGFEAAHLHSTNVDNWALSSRVKLVSSLRAAGILVYGSAAVYGNSAAYEGKKAAYLVEQYDLAGWIFDAEKGPIEDADNAPALARAMLEGYKSATKKPAAWCWWPFYKSTSSGSQLHPLAVLKAAMQYCEVGMPMAYWSWGNDAANAVRYLEASWKQWKEATSKPIVVAGRACVGDGGIAKPPAVLAYDKRARELGAAGITWWSMEHALNESAVPGVWAALAQTPKMGTSYPEEEENMYTDCPMGLVTRTNTWTNTLYKFVAGIAHDPRTMEPNALLAPIEKKAAEQKIPFGIIWNLDITDYSMRQLGENNWPGKDSDWQLQKFIEAVRYRDPKFVVIRFTDEAYKNYATKKDEQEAFVSFVGQTLTGRIGDWLKANKPGCKLLVGASDAWIKAHAPNMDNWVAQYERGWIVQEYASAADLDASFPPASGKPGFLGASDGWRFWQYYTNAVGDNLVIYNSLVPVKDLNTWLGFNPGGQVPVPDTTAPAVPAGLVATASGQMVSLSWQPVADAAVYRVYQNGAFLESCTANTRAYNDMAAGTYSYQVSAVDSAGNESTKSAAAVVMVGSPAPEDNTAVMALLKQLKTLLEGVVTEQQAQRQTLTQIRGKFS